MIDLNQEQDQQSRNYGPVPAGSTVFLRLTIKTPKYPSGGDPYVAKSQGGLLYLDATYEVIQGTFEEVKFYEMLWLPVGMQTIRLTEGQVKACNIAGRKMKAIVSAAKGVALSDKSEKASRVRTLNSWLDLSGLEFPAVLALNDKPYEKDGKFYWNNCIASIVTPDSSKYTEVYKLGELLTDGPVSGEIPVINSGTQSTEYESPFPDVNLEPSLAGGVSDIPWD